jgi:class 3 adenylate cyclase
MHCPNCSTNNPDGAKFCNECATPLTKGEMVKRRNGEKENDAGRRTSDTGRSDGERRQLTVMFCDLVDSTALSAQLDPEEYREVVRTYQQTSAAVIERFDGYIAQYLGDGLLVV